MIRRYKLNNEDASLQEVMDYIEDELTRGGNETLFQELGIDFCDVTSLEDLDTETLEKIKNDYREIEDIIAIIREDEPISNVRNALKGHNFDPDNQMFDLYWGKDKNMIVTIHKNSAGFYVGQYIEYCIDDMFVEIDTGSWTGREW